jgi:hypothetical protein
VKNNEIHVLYPSPDMIRVIKSRRVGLKGHVGEEKCIEVLVGSTEG